MYYTVFLLSYCPLGHYSLKAQDKARYFADTELNAAKIWKDFCKS